MEELKIVSAVMCPKCHMHSRKWTVTEEGYRCGCCGYFLKSPTRAPKPHIPIEVRKSMEFLRNAYR